MARCKCNHGMAIHDKVRDQYNRDHDWIAQHKNGCRAANCKCKKFQEKK